MAQTLAGSHLEFRIEGVKTQSTINRQVLLLPATATLGKRVDAQDFHVTLQIMVSVHADLKLFSTT